VASFDLKAFSPLWHAPQNLPALISAIVIVAAPSFPGPFIGKIAGWQAAHLFPASAWDLPSKTTLPESPPLNSSVFPGPTAIALPAKTTATAIANIIVIILICSPPFFNELSAMLLIYYIDCLEFEQLKKANNSIKII
jgi:hypothetical protein